MKNFNLIRVLLIVSILFNLLAVGLGFTYLRYIGLPIPYAVSRAPYVVSSMLGLSGKELGLSGEEKHLKQIIIQEYPELEMPDTTDYEKARILRHWVAQVVDWSTQSLLLDIRVPNFSFLSAYEMYKLFINDEGGVWCGVASDLLRKVYRLFGFESYHLNYGIPDTVTHVVTLVVIEHDGQEILSVQDAYFDVTYEFPSGEPMDYFTMLALLKEKRDDEISVVEPVPPLVRDVHLYHGDSWLDRDYWLDVDGNRVDKSKVSGITTARCPFTMDSVLASFHDKINTFLTENGLPPRLVYLYLFPVSIGDRSQGKLFLDKARQITGWPPPVSPQMRLQGERLKQS